ncbi:hypothetical protein [Microvirga thermotolerans]|uniref:Uncharacterized protein n=1 Tax=Microvirga thermotolerans TaxID=2651334 RepID=A0A5P9K1F0_9HYPH|nr:hypothetical protein [Microvirga thermotolerans]QFU16034.1 hypothetical protein GDR74_07235 [Microvirga thermotolerans]
MKQSPSDPYDWYDDDSTLRLTAGAVGGPLPGLPPAWQNLGWWTGGIAFAALWLFETWSISNPSVEKEGLVRLVESFWGLLLALAICYGIFKFCMPRYRVLGHVLCIVSAIVLLLHHVA